MSDFETVKTEIIDQLSNLTVLQIAELVGDLEEKWGVTAAAAVAAAPAADAAGGVAQAAQTEFDVMLASIGDQKIKVIKEVRSITGLGLKEAKGLVDGAPCALKEGISKEEADEIKGKLEEVGATIEIK